jgi:hypothetical protein
MVFLKEKVSTFTAKFSAASVFQQGNKGFPFDQLFTHAF